MYKLKGNKVPTIYPIYAYPLQNNYSENQFTANYYKSSGAKHDNNYYKAQLVEDNQTKVNQKIGYNQRLDVKGCYYGCKN